MVEPYTNNPKLNLNLAALCSQACRRFQVACVPAAPQRARARPRGRGGVRARVPARGGSKGRGREGSEEAATIAAPSLTPTHPPTGLRRARGRAPARYGGADG